MATIISTKTSGVGGLSVTGDASGILQLASADGTTALTIDALQNVGIGTSSPACRLNVVSGTNNGIQVYDGTVNTLIYNTGSNLSVIGTNTNHPLALYTNNTERMRINSSGNVGIGTSSPAERLTVNSASSEFAIQWSGPGNEWVLASAANRSYIRNKTASVETLTILNAGNVGIGTSSPAAKLDVYAASGYLDSRFRSGTVQAFVGADGGSTYFGTYSNVPVLFTQNNTERMRIDSSGNLLVGTTSNTVNNSNSFVYRQDLGAEILNHISGTVTGSQYIYFGYNGSVIGSVTQNLTTGVLYNVSSDQRLKTNIQPAGSAIQSILDFPVDQFDWISDSSHQDFGGVAQKILKVIPEMVSVPENPEEMMGLDWSKAVPRLIKTIQELKAIIDTQTARIEALEAKI